MDRHRGTYGGRARGFSLTEVLVAASISTVILGGAMSIYIISHQILREGVVRNDLCTTASYVVKHMTTNLLQATVMEITNNGTRLRFQLPGDVNSRWYYVQSGEMYYFDGTQATYLTHVNGIAAVTVLFSPYDSYTNARTVQIALTLQQIVVGTRPAGDTVTVAVTTTVSRRN